VASVLKCLGLADLAADTPAEFVVKAAGLAAQGKRLALLRESLRQRLQRSALCDGAGFTRGLETLYRELWQRWTSGMGCGQPPQSGPERLVRQRPSEDCS
jgi:predicted O-linked N-acetylglucosamine transferase (SPINDLY family)